MKIHIRHGAFGLKVTKMCPCEICGFRAACAFAHGGVAQGGVAHGGVAHLHGGVTRKGSSTSPTKELSRLNSKCDSVFAPRKSKSETIGIPQGLWAKTGGPKSVPGPEVPRNIYKESGPHSILTRALTHR
jgi:hypothetical protein